MPHAKIKIVPPFDMILSLRFATACRFESENDCREGKFRRIIKIDNVPVLLTITVSGNVENPAGRVQWSMPEGGNVRRKTILDLSRRIVSADLDLEPFYKQASNSHTVKKVTDTFRGLKPILTPTVYESAAWAIMGQQVNLNFAYTLKKRITEKYGRTISIDNRKYALFPEPVKFKKVTVGQLRRLQFSTRKAEYLLGLSKSVTNGELNLELLAGENYENALEKLLTVRGIGIWSANYILMRGAGQLNCLPLGDSGLHRAVKNWYKLKNLPDHEKVKKLAKPCAPFRSLYTLYLWYSLLNS